MRLGKSQGIARFALHNNGLHRSLIRLAHSRYLFPFGSVNPSVRLTSRVALPRLDPVNTRFHPLPPTEADTGSIKA